MARYNYNRQYTPPQMLAARATRQERQVALFRRNQTLGIVLIALMIAGWTAWRTNPAWLFPVGWWRP